MAGSPPVNPLDGESLACHGLEDEGYAEPMKLTIPALSLVVLIGPSGAGKVMISSIHAGATMPLSSDAQPRLLLREALPNGARFDR